VDRVVPGLAFVKFEKQATENSVPDRFEQQVAAYPDHLAVKTRLHQLTYSAFNKVANRIAHTVGQQSGKAEPVALLLDHDAWAVVAIFGLLKAGRSFVPLDPSLPEVRLKYMLEDSGAKLIITNSERLNLSQVLRGKSRGVIDLDHLDVSLPNDNPGMSISPGSMTCILYTSGTTGRPKGVVHSHRNELHNVMHHTNSLSLNANDRLTLLGSYSTGQGIQDLYCALLNGASLYPWSLKSEGLIGLANWLIGEGITVYHSAATVFRHFVRNLNGAEEFPHLRIVRLGSEPVSWKDVEAYKKYFSRRCVFVNALSSSETKTIRQYVIDKESQITGRVPVGYPVEDMDILILDDSGNELGPGEVGEVAVRGGYLSPGYWRQPDLTSAAFLPDPSSPTKRIFRTGEWGRMSADGCLVHLGRKDAQVKIRGYRVETFETELALLEHFAVDQVLVMCRDNIRGDKYLVAYIVLNRMIGCTVSELRIFLKEKIPDYMIPSAFIFLDSLPLTPNGKIDRGALPEPSRARPALDVPYAPPRTRLEKRLAESWAQVLGLDNVGIHDNFFDLGGDSLTASMAISSVSKTFRSNLLLREFFETPRITSIAKRFERALGESRRPKLPPLLPAPRKEYLPLSFAQEQLWFLNESRSGTPLFNLPSAHRLSGSLDVGILQESLRQLVERHEALRTVFGQVDGQPVQIIGQVFDIDVSLVDLRHLPVARREKEAARLAEKETSRPFDLATGPLIRTKLFRLAEDEHALLVIIHHIISDGWSSQVFWNELAIVYDALSRGRKPFLPENPIQFIDFVCWEQHALDDKFIREQLEYWERQLAGTLPRLEFRGRTRRKKAGNFRTAQLPIELDENLFSTVKDFSHKERSTPFMVLLTALDITLHAYTGKKDIRVGTLIANRDRAETERLIGNFINTVILRSRVDRKMTLRELLAQVRETTLAAYANQHLPFEHLVRTLEQKRKIKRTSLFQVLFVYHNMIFQISNPPNLTFKPQEKRWVRADPGITLTTFDLILVLKETSKRLVGTFTFKRDALDSRKANGILQKLIRSLEYLTSDPEATIGKICGEGIG